MDKDLRDGKRNVRECQHSEIVRTSEDEDDEDATPTQSSKPSRNRLILRESFRIVPTCDCQTKIDFFTRYSVSKL